MDRHRHIHQLECAGYKMNLWRSIGIAHLSFRTFVVGVQDALERLSGDVQRSSAADMVDKLLAVKDEQFTYASVLRLVTNFDKMSARDTLSYALTAYMLAVYLDEYTTLRDKFAHLMESSMDWHVLSRVLIMKHIGQLVVLMAQITFQISLSFLQHSEMIDPIFGSFRSFDVLHAGVEWTCDNRLRATPADTDQRRLQTRMRQNSRPAPVLGGVVRPHVHRHLSAHQHSEPFVRPEHTEHVQRPIPVCLCDARHYGRRRDLQLLWAPLQNNVAQRATVGAAATVLLRLQV